MPFVSEWDGQQGTQNDGLQGGCVEYLWTTDLLPGHILSLTRCVPPKKKKKIEDLEKGGDESTVNDVSLSNAIIPVEDGDVVPADILLLRGSTVVNEASLTGESVPQMKEVFSELVEGEILDMKTRHKTHVLYAGTKMLPAMQGCHYYR